MGQTASKYCPSSVDGIKCIPVPTE